MSRLYAIHLAFCGADLLRAGLKRYRETTSLTMVTHVIVDQHYPLRREENRPALEELAKEYDAVFIDSGKDLGLHHGFNNAIAELEEEDGLGAGDDLIIIYDPDSYPVEPAWDAALVNVMTADPSMAYVGLMTEPAYNTPNKTWKQETIGGRSVLIPSGPCQINVACWRHTFIRKAGGLKEFSQFYGHLETAMWLEMRKQFMWMGYLADFHESFDLFAMHDPEYQAWKDAHARAPTPEARWEGDFASYLAARAGAK